MSVVGKQIAELYDSIATFQTELDALEERQSVERSELSLKHTEELAELSAKSEKAKKEFSSYLKDAGVDAFLTPAQSKGKSKLGDTLTTTEGKVRKKRTSSEDRKVALERNLAIYTSSYESGINDKTGLPNRFKGRNQKNVEINRMMKQDEDAYKKANEQ